MASKIATLQFVDSHPSRRSKREQELIRAEARSHAAKVAHARSRNQVDCKDSQNPIPADSQPVLDASNPPTINNSRLTISAASAVATVSKELPERSVRPWQKFNQKDVPFNRFRVGAYHAKAATKQDEGPQSRREAPGNGEDSTRLLLAQAFIPRLRGNSDPFNATLVPLSPVEHVLLQQSRDQLVGANWPSEIAIRRNHSSLMTVSWKIVPPTLDDEAANHALIAQSYYSRASRQRVAGQLPDKGLVQAEKHKFQALRGLQQQLEANRQCPGDRQRLRAIFLACSWIAGCEMLCQNWDATEMHFIALRKIVDLCGGWSAFSRMEREIVVGAACLLASGKRSRPVIELEDFDPGPWHAYKASNPLPFDGLDLDIPVAALASSTPPLTTVSPRLRRFFEEIRELLAIEEIKLQNASSQRSSAIRMFRWSHARKLGIRSRGLHYWCDLLDAAKAEGAPIITPLHTPLALTFDFALCVAARCFDRCVFDDHYQPVGVYAESKRYHMEMVSVMQPLRPTADDFSLVPDEHTFDILWIYSVGAYVEDVFMRPELEKRGGPLPPPFAKRFFSTRFSYLVAANLQFTKFEEVTKFLRENYLYCPRLQDESLRKLVSFTGDEQLTMEEVLNGP